MFDLILRTQYPGRTSSQHMVYLEEKDALAILGQHTLISLINSEETASEVPPLPAVIERVPFRKAHQRAWCLRIGDHIAKRIHPKTGERTTVLFSDDHVRDLAELTAIPFEKGQPDWELRKVEDLEDEATRLEIFAAEARKRAQQAREARIMANKKVP